MNNKLSKITASIILGSMVMYTLPVAAFTKDETVYSNLKPDGKEYQTIVATHLLNEDDEKLLKDMTDLLNIENTSGDEKFEKDGDSIVWEANSNDIYYKGGTNKELPIGIEIQYKLDGKEMTPNEIKGKSGEIDITIKLKNKQKKEVIINGKTEELYIPFVIACGTYINNENNKNIEVKNGKIIDDGSKSIIAGLAFPGMQESLQIDKEMIEIPDAIEIKMKSENFEMNNILFYSMPINPEDLDIDIFSKLNNLYEKVGDLKSASNAIEEGAKTLSEGTRAAKDGSNKIKSEVDKAITNMKYDNSNALDNNTLNAIQYQAGQSAVLSEQDKRTIIQGVDAGIDAQAQTIKAQYIESAKTIAAQTAVATAQQTALASAQKAKIETKAAVKNAAIAAAIQANPGLSEEQANAIGEAIASTISTELTEAEKQEILNNINQDEIIAAAYSGIAAQEATIGAQGVESAKMIARQSALGVASNVAKTTAEKTSRQVAAQVGNKVKQEATKKVVSEMSTLSDGLNQLSTGLTTLDEGANKLAAGTHEFNESGINKIDNFINKNIKQVSIRAEKIMEIAKEYKTFTKIDDTNKGKVKFITIVDSLKKEEDTRSQEKTEEKSSK